MLNKDAYVDWVPCEEGEIIPHPSDICEPLNLACTSLPSLIYKMKWSGSHNLSTFQIETIRRIFQSFSIRKAFLLGDATGVGKGRTIAGVLHECKEIDPTFKSIWISANTRLRKDAEAEINLLGQNNIVESNIRFTSYTALLNSKNFISVVEFLKSSNYNIIILDECHILRNSSQTAKQIQKLIEEIPSSCILYSSATAASSWKHLEYLDRLDLWGNQSPFSSYNDLASALKAHGAPLMELLSIQMRASGAYVSRQLSFSNITMENVLINLTSKEKAMYDNCVQVLRTNNYISGVGPQFFYQQLITGIKAKYAVELARKCIAKGNAVIISLINTGEAFVRRDQKSRCNAKFEDYCVGEEIFERFGEIVDDIPVNPIDYILNEFGHDNVAELTGRMTTLKKDSTGKLNPYMKPKLVEETEKFQKGEKNIAILSKAGGIGISLHDNVLGRKRSHIILEMPWSAEDFMQQLGRSHRSNSLTNPEYYLMMTDIPAEMRFATAIVDKLSSMGALIKGDRTCCDISWMNIPRWGPDVKRSIALYLSTAEAMCVEVSAEDSEVTLPKTKNEAINAISLKNTCSDITIKNKLTEYLLIDNTNDNPKSKRIYIECAKLLFPHDICSLFHVWNPNVHKIYPEPFKRKVFKLLCCHASWDCRKTLGMLPEVLVHKIIEIMSVPSKLQTVAEASRVFRTHDFKLHQLGQVVTEHIFNRMLGMELHIQESIFTYTQFATIPKQEVQVSCFMRYIRERTGSNINCEINEIRLASFSEGARGVQINISYSPREVHDPAAENIWYNEKNGRCVWVDEHKSYYSDGNVRKENTSTESLLMRGFKRSNLETWSFHTRKTYNHSLRKCRKMNTNFFLATNV